MTRLMQWIADRALGDGTAACRMKTGGNFRAGFTVKPLPDGWLVAVHHDNPLPAWLLHPEAVEADALGVAAAAGR